MLSVDMFLHVCMCGNIRCSSPSHRHQPTHWTGLQTNTHTNTCKRTQARPSLPNPPRFAVYCFSPFAVRLSCCWGLEFCLLGERSEGERQMERRSGDKEEMEVLDGPQLLRAIVSMTCSSLLLSLCLLACSSRSNADKISSLYLTM